MRGADVGAEETSDKPLLLMDVDGPLNPFEAPWFDDATPPYTYSFHDLTVRGESYKVALNAYHGRELRALQTVYDLVWATTWREDANRLISPILGLPNDLPVMPLFQPWGWPHRRSWKLEQIVNWVDGRSFAWFDDGINRRTREWLKSADVAPHLLLRVPANRGLLGADFDEIWQFADGLAGRRRRLTE